MENEQPEMGNVFTIMEDADTSRNIIRALSSACGLSAIVCVARTTAAERNSNRVSKDAQITKRAEKALKAEKSCGDSSWEEC